MRNFGGKVLFLDRSDINTDEIIPARYLTEVSKEALKPCLLEDLNLEGFDPEKDIKGRQVVVARANFGCGSSREHAPWALEVNGIHMVIAESFARIFRQNMFNCGMLAIELPSEAIDRIFDEFAGADTEIYAGLDTGILKVKGGGGEDEIAFSISEFDRALVEAGGWVEYADLHY
ncbi:MAG: 3-isopropylmalate dehydratase small subunit [Desulfobacteraceae bacterium]|nr:3-isopropylmalate dehydratase small subunit [Desulfobacteraceae bacterium]MCF8094139.1 3-isopropylmalate dehydratase small subunit [Desulfobacteraceae bacterium]